MSSAMGQISVGGVFLLLLGRCYAELPGHLQPLGSHMDPELVRRTGHLPSPLEFYENYVAPQTPLIIEGALKGSTVWKDWQSDQYIR